MRLLWSSSAMDFLGDQSDLVFSLVAQVLLLGLLPFFLYKRLMKKKTKEVFSDFSFRKISWKEILISVGLGIVVFLLNVFVSTFFSFILSMFGYHSRGAETVITGWDQFALQIFLAAILPGIFEEVTHRGMLLKGYHSLGLKRSVLYSALLFGLIHMNVNQTFFTFIIGIILAMVTLSSGSIFPAMIIHFSNNFYNNYFLFASQNDLFLGNFYEKLQNFISGGSAIGSIIIVSLLILILVYLLLWGIMALLKLRAGRTIRNITGQIAVMELRRQLLEGIEPDAEHSKTEATVSQDGKVLRINLPIEELGIPLNPLFKPTLSENMFFYASVFMGAIVTFFTFVWGLL